MCFYIKRSRTRSLFIYMNTQSLPLKTWTLSSITGVIWSSCICEMRPLGNSITMSTHFCPLTASMAELPVSPEYQILKKTVTQTYLNELYVIFFEVIDEVNENIYQQKHDWRRYLPPSLIKCSFRLDRKYDRNWPTHERAKSLKDHVGPWNSSITFNPSGNRFIVLTSGTKDREKALSMISKIIKIDIWQFSLEKNTSC